MRFLIVIDNQTKLLQKRGPELPHASLHLDMHYALIGSTTWRSVRHSTSRDTIGNAVKREINRRNLVAIHYNTAIRNVRNIGTDRLNHFVQYCLWTDDYRPWVVRRKRKIEVLPEQATGKCQKQEARGKRYFMSKYEPFPVRSKLAYFLESVGKSADTSKGK